MDDRGGGLTNVAGVGRRQEGGWRSCCIADGLGGQVIVLGPGYWGEQVGGPNLTKMGTPVSES